MNQPLRFAPEAPQSGIPGAFALNLQGRMPTLATRRLLLRAPRAEDFDAYSQILCSDRGTFMGGPLTREDTWADFCNATATWILHGHGLWTIGYGGNVAGFARLGVETGDREPELSYMLLPAYEGMGLATEAARAVRDHAFEAFGWSTLVSYVAPGHRRSARVALRLGAREDGTASHDGDTVTVYRYSPEGRA